MDSKQDCDKFSAHGDERCCKEYADKYTCKKKCEFQKQELGEVLFV